MKTMNEILTSARDLLDRLLEDVSKAKTREEHIRITARANEAATIVSELESLVTKE
jgi:hypothetical protein